MESGMDTDRYESLLQLSSSQVLAVEALDAGSTHHDAALAAGVNRVTVSRWVRHHPAFIAEMNRRRVERLEHLSAQIGDVTSRAIDVVAKAISDGDLSTALAWVRLTCVSSRSAIEASTAFSDPVTPGEVIDQAAEYEARRQPMGAFTDAYRPAALRSIWADLEGSAQSSL